MRPEKCQDASYCALCDGWTVEWRTIDALLVKCELVRTAMIFAIKRHGKPNGSGLARCSWWTPT